MKKKYIDGSNWGLMANYSSVVTRTEEEYTGYISLVYCHEIKQTISVDYDDSNTVLIDKDYRCVLFLPDHETYCASAVYDAENILVEWYFDMTKENNCDHKPYFMDLFLDVAVSPDRKAVVIDEDELLDAYTAGIITKDDVDLAYQTSQQVLKNLVDNDEFMVDFFNKALITLMKQLN